MADPAAAAMLVKRDLRRLETLRPHIEEAAQAFGVPAAVLAAIISRESGAGLFLDSRGLGDGGHGHGLTQIDDRSFGQWCGAWREIWRASIPDAHREAIRKGAEVLRDKRTELAAQVPGASLVAPRLPALTEAELLRAAVAAYNCGARNVLKAYAAKADVDRYTTGRDYSADVMARAAWLAAHGWRW